MSILSSTWRVVDGAGVCVCCRGLEGDLDVDDLLP